MSELDQLGTAGDQAKAHITAALDQNDPFLVGELDRALASAL